MAGKFEIWTDAQGEYRFHLKAGNGEVIATSEGYTTKASAKSGIASVQANAPTAEIVELDS
ncbi:hypothetical protein EDF64_103321 [Curtobacterium flaccumfaciens]|uniref:DUF1508 domain-containing protein n=1 Tax=Curtobacterium flaccumfaciens TaxID=2035 RepID=A0A4R6DKU8_9MICO|nr:YegP family protein [Curtobacterium flaccumfaciens]TDN45397.1 hypothetical protein EDF64_103321 [Curtobacterium flaccumfaciens]